MLLALPCLAQALVPGGYHRREVSGWTLLAVSLPIDGFTACVMDPLPLPVSVTATRDPFIELESQELAGHPLYKASGAQPDELLRALVTRARLLAKLPGGSPYSEGERHLIYLAGLRLPVLSDSRPGGTPARPVLLLAGDQAPSELMRILVRHSDELPMAAGEAPHEEVEPPADGWWRHLERREPGTVLVGTRILPGVSLDAPAAQVAWRALERRIEHELKGSVQARWTANTNGGLWWVRWTAPPDSLAFCRDSVKRVLGALREGDLSAEEYADHRAWCQRREKAAWHSPERFFEHYLLAELQGRLPPPQGGTPDPWDGVDQETVRQMVLTFFSREVVGVTAGTLDLGVQKWPAEPEPTEYWHEAEMAVEDLRPEARQRLARAALDRAARSLWAGAPPGSLKVESSWVYERPESPLAGTLEEVFVFPGRVRRTFYPLGTGEGIKTWLVDGQGGAEDFEMKRALSANERRQLRLRLALDPWSLLREHWKTDHPLRYLGARALDGGVCQGVASVHGADSLTVYLDALSGLPVCVTLDGKGGFAPTQKLRCTGYVDWGGCRYPSRLERFSAIKREVVQTVEKVSYGSHLAGSSLLK